VQIPAAGLSDLELVHKSPTSLVPGSTGIRLFVRVTEGFHKHPEQERLARLGCSVLAQGTHRELGSGTSIWTRLLPQLSNAIPAVNAAAAALGAIYESISMTDVCSPTNRRSATLQYGKAIHHLQKEVSTQRYGPVPVLMSCALLASVELLRRRQYYALMHLQGAMKLLRHRNQTLSSTKGPEPTYTSELGALHEATGGVADNLTLMFLTLDIQKASYILSQPPDLDALSDQDLRLVSSNTWSVTGAEFQLVRLIHTSYHFTAQASQFKYLPRAAVPCDLVFKQGLLIAKLSIWLDILNQNFSSNQVDSAHKLSSEGFYHTLILRSQCLSTLVYLSTVLSPHECSYDIHGPRFQRIVQDAGTILSNDGGSVPELRQFRPSPGIIQPLFLAATKYRHAVWRRRAIELVRRAGREGPFDGLLLAAVANRAVEIEEGSFRPLVPRGILPEHVAEADRVHGCGVDAEAKDDDEPIRSVPVMFSLCQNVDGMLSGPEPWDHGSNWNIWHEVVEF
jgi:hypothetical protein